MHRLFKAALPAALLVVASNLAAQQRLAAPMTPAALRTRLEAYAADSMRGRLTGTIDNLKGVRWIAAELERAGLEPAGENGTFFQRVPLARLALDTANSNITLGGQTLRPYVDYLPRNQGNNARSFDGVETIFAGTWGAPGMLTGEAVRGKVVVLATPVENYSVIKLQAQAAFAQAAAIVIANFDITPPGIRAQMSASPMALDAGDAATPEMMSYLHLSRMHAAQLLGVTELSAATIGQSGGRLGGRISYKKVSVDAMNVVAVLRGSDATLRNEYVAVGAHSDHVGVSGRAVDRDSLRAFNLELRAKQLANNGEITQAMVDGIRVNMDSIRRIYPTARMDSIYNGADDDGSGSMAVLETARAFAAQRVKPKRSILFVWHTGEELGLFGSEHFTDHPTVPRDQIVAQINLDMVGRGRAGDELAGGPNYMQLLGSRRLSTTFGDLVEQVSRDKGFNWAFDYQYDANGHPEQYYCRSDHYMYARYGIPIVFMSTGGHADYHQVTDEIEYIDFEKLAKVTRFTHELANAVGNAATRPVVDKPKPDPRGQCVQ
jgi:hypothetical protein